MIATAAIQVEVSLQDYFFADLSISLTETNSLTETDSWIERTATEGKTAEGTEIQSTDRLDAPVAPKLWQIWFQHWLEQLEADLPASRAYELSLRLTDDAEIQALNAQYRHKNQPTDVLAFAALEVDYPQPDDEIAASLPLYLGDIVISVETAQKQAMQIGHSLQHELAWLAAHALLHLLGWDHPDEASLTCMLKQQELLLQTVGLPIDSYQIEKSPEQEYSATEQYKV